MLIEGIFKPEQVFNKAEVNETIKKAREGAMVLMWLVKGLLLWYPFI